jgi:hypothetical protein
MANGHGGRRPNTGGARPGAGRKKGAETRRTLKTTALAERQAGEGILPLAVLMKAMRAYDAAGETDKAVAVAEKAAPYCHRKLSPRDEPADDTAPLTDERRLALLVVLLGRAGQRGARPPALPGPAPPVVADPGPAGP